MPPEIIHYSDISELVLNTQHLNVIFAYGTGDTFNAMLHFGKAPPQRAYSLIIKKPQYNLVMFMLGNITPQPARIHVVDYHRHDFAFQLASLFPSLPGARGVEPFSNRDGLIDFWQNPFNYQKIIPLTGADIDNWVSYFQSQPPTTPFPENSVVFFTTAGVAFEDYVPPWKRMADILRERGFQHFFVNQSGFSHYSGEDIPDLTPFSPPHDEMLRMFYAPDAKVKIIAVRSGAVDLLRFTPHQALVLYQPEPKGIFETCRFGLLEHRFDCLEAICLKHTPDHQDEVLLYYMQRFFQI